MTKEKTFEELLTSDEFKEHFGEVQPHTEESRARRAAIKSIVWGQIHGRSESQGEWVKE